MKHAHPIYTGLYRLDIREFNSDVAHIYEHLLLATFLAKLQTAGFSAYLYGWLGGDTYREAIFIRYGFYNPKVEQLFRDFMCSATRIDIKYLESALSSVAAEEKSLLQADREQLLVQLRAIDSARWDNVDQVAEPARKLKGHTKQVDQSIVRFQKASKKFRDVTIAVSIEHLKLVELLAYQRVHVIILDIIHVVTQKFGLYERAGSVARYHEPTDSMSTFGIFSLQRGGPTAKDIKAAVTEAMQRFSLRDHDEDLTYYREALVAVSTWNDFPVQYFEDSSILASRQQVADSLTLDRVESIIHGLTVHVSPTHALHWEKL